MFDQAFLFLSGHRLYSKKCFVSRLDLRNYIDSDSIIATVENKKSKKNFPTSFGGGQQAFE
jgi:hypothetical protein